MLRRVLIAQRRTCSKVAVEVSAKGSEGIKIETSTVNHTSESVVASSESSKPPEEKEQILWQDHDTAADIKRGEAVEGFEDVDIKPEHYELAVRALLYGTALAIIFVGGSSVACMKYFGFNTLREVAHHIRTSPDRKPQSEFSHTVDLFQPSTWGTAWDAILDDLKRMEAIERSKKAEEETSQKASVA